MNKTADGQVIADDEVATLEDETMVANDGEDGGSPSEVSTESDDVVVTIGEEAPPPEEENHAPEWVRELRKTNREDKRRIRELEEKLNAKTAETKPATLGEKPTLEKYDYDTESYAAALEAWYQQKRDADNAAAKAEEVQKEQQKAWQAKLDAYGKAKSELKVKDFEDAEATVQDVLNVTQQGIVLQGAENPALIIYALGKNPKKAAELSAITDPVKFAFSVAKLETQLKVTQRKAVAPPERVVQGTGNKSGTVDSTLERLRAEAAKTGDFTKVVQYKKSKQTN